jgi:hypothetical protein
VREAEVLGNGKVYRELGSLLQRGEGRRVGSFEGRQRRWGRDGCEGGDRQSRSPRQRLRRLDDKEIRAGEERGTKGVKARGLGEKEVARSEEQLSAWNGVKVGGRRRRVRWGSDNCNEGGLQSAARMQSLRLGR